MPTSDKSIATQEETSCVLSPIPEPVASPRKLPQLKKKSTIEMAIHAVYGVLDGLSLSFSMPRYFFDLKYNDTNVLSSDMMHEWMLTPEGIAAMLLIGTGFVLTSFFANTFDPKDVPCDFHIKEALPSEEERKAYLKPCYILVGKALYYYDCANGTCIKIHEREDDFPFTEDIDTLSDEQLRDITKRTGHRQHRVKTLISTYWPYIRDAMKALKNGYKGFRTAFLLLLTFLPSVEVRFLLFPVGFALAGLSVLNRFWLRQVRTERKKLITTNKKEMQRIIDKKILNNDDMAQLETAIKLQQDWMASRAGKAFLAELYGGFLDGLYLYLGAGSLATLAPPLFIALTVISCIYVLINVITRMYDEKKEQRELRATQAKLLLIINGWKLEQAIPRLLESGERDDPNDQQIAYKDAQDLLTEYKKQKDELNQHIKLSYGLAVLMGLKNGLAAYGAISSAMFALATICAMMTLPFPPFLLMPFVVSGLVAIIGFTVHALRQVYLEHSREKETQLEWEHLKEQSFSDNASAILKQHKPKAVENTVNKKLDEILQKLKRETEKAKGDHEALKKIIKEDFLRDIQTIITYGNVVDPSAQFFFQEGFEVIRSIFSGIGKGQKAVDLFFNLCQELIQGHYHDTPIMFKLSAVFACIFAGGLAARAYLQGFKPSFSKQADPPPKSNDVTLPHNEAIDKDNGIQTPTAIDSQSVTNTRQADCDHTTARSSSPVPATGFSLSNFQFVRRFLPLQHDTVTPFLVDEDGDEALLAQESIMQSPLCLDTPSPADKVVVDGKRECRPPRHSLASPRSPSFFVSLPKRPHSAPLLGKQDDLPDGTLPRTFSETDLPLINFVENTAQGLA